MKKKKLLKMKYIATAIVVLLIFISLISSGCIFDQENGHDWADPYTELTYELVLTSENETTVLLPVPIYNSGKNVSSLVEEIQMIEGDVDFNLNQTKYGPALNITFEGKAHLKAHKKEEMNDGKLDKYKFTDLSMAVNNTGKYYVYSSSKDANITEFICSEKVGGGEDVDWPHYFSVEELSLEEGWESIPLGY